MHFILKIKKPQNLKDSNFGNVFARFNGFGSASSGTSFVNFDLISVTIFVDLMKKTVFGSSGTDIICFVTTTSVILLLRLDFLSGLVTIVSVRGPKILSLCVAFHRHHSLQRNRIIHTKLLEIFFTWKN